MYICKRELAAIALLSSAIPLNVMAADAHSPYPQRQITLIIGFPPGGGADALARLFAKHMSEELGQNIIVDYRPGAAGNIGAKAVARAQPDGYTIYLGARPNTIHKAMYPQLDYDFSRELVPIGLAATMPYIIAVGKDAALASVADIIALAKAYPGAPTCASAGVGTSDHLLCTMFQQETGTDIAHVPYRGGLQAYTDVIGGRVDMRFGSLPASLPHIVAGNLRPIAVMSKSRASTLPHTPTIAEAGFPNLALDAWYGLMAPAGTPAQAVARLNQSMNTVLATQDMQEALIQLAYVPPPPETPESFGALIVEETDRWMRVLRQHNFTAAPNDKSVDSATRTP
jgi:tripartite-type tricarboxylate transporter receptor subunit TctC